MFCNSGKCSKFRYENQGNTEPCACGARLRERPHHWHVLPFGHRKSQKYPLCEVIDGSRANPAACFRYFRLPECRHDGIVLPEQSRVLWRNDTVMRGPYQRARLVAWGHLLGQAAECKDAPLPEGMLRTEESKDGFRDTKPPPLNHVSRHILTAWMLPKGTAVRGRDSSALRLDWELYNNNIPEFDIDVKWLDKKVEDAAGFWHGYWNSRKLSRSVPMIYMFVNVSCGLWSKVGLNLAHVSV